MRGLIIALIVILAIAACSAGDDDEDQIVDPPTATLAATSLPAVATIPSEPTATTQIIQPSATPEPTATATEPEPTSTEAEASATSTASSTATAGMTPSATSSVEATTTSLASPSATGDERSGGKRPEDELALSMLLEESDLPEGWLLIRRNFGDDEDDEEGLCGALPISQFATPTGISEASFQISDGGPFLQQGVALFETEEDASAGIAYIRATLTCTEWTQIDGQQEVNWTIAPLDIPTVGDDLVAFQISLDDGAFSLQGDYILFRQQRALILLVTLAVDERVPTEIAIAAAESAAERVAARQ